jgi:hypothetical protein
VSGEHVGRVVVISVLRGGELCTFEVVPIERAAA